MTIRKIAGPVFYVYIATMLALSFYPIEKVAPGGDKLHHLAAFLLYVVLFYAAFEKAKPIPAALSALALGVFIEAVQYFLPFRSAEFMDVAADAGGIVIGLVLVYMYNRYRLKRPEL